MIVMERFIYCMLLISHGDMLGHILSDKIASWSGTRLFILMPEVQLSLCVWG